MGGVSSGVYAATFARARLRLDDADYIDADQSAPLPHSCYRRHALYRRQQELSMMATAEMEEYIHILLMRRMRAFFGRLLSTMLPPLSREYDAAKAAWHHWLSAPLRGRRYARMPSGYRRQQRSHTSASPPYSPPAIRL